MDSPPPTRSETMLVPFALARGDGTIVEANDSFQALAGPIDGRKLADIGVAADDVGRGLRRVRLTKPDGTSAEVLFVVSQSSSAEHGSVLAIVALSDKALVEEERELRELARFPRANPAPVLRMDREGRIVSCNPAAERLFRNTDLKSAPWQDVCGGVDDEFWSRVLKDNTPPSIETNIGEETVRFEHVRAPSGEIVTAFGIITTDFRRAERELDEKANELAEIARFPDMNPGPVIRTNNEGEILLANSAAREIFGGLLVGRNWRDVCPNVDDQSWRAIVAADDVVPVEGRVGGHDFVFNHRSDPQTNLVFVYGTDVTGQKQAEQALRQNKKMATLGTLAAGVTHELNNPAAATRRAADQLKEKLAALELAHLSFNPAAQSEQVQAALHQLLDQAREASGNVGDLDAIGRADKEMELEDWLDEKNVPDLWEIGADLVAAGLEPALLEPLAEGLAGPDLAGALNWVASVFNIASLANTVSHGGARLSEIVSALKGYSYLGQAPIQDVDLREGLENTLVILRSKLKYGITLHRDYADNMPLVPAYGSELNQV